MEILEKYYIFRKTKLNNQINDKLTIKRNVIFSMTATERHLMPVLRADNNQLQSYNFGTPVHSDTS